MKFNTFRYYALAIGSLSGTIIGVGMFGLPYAALQAGFFLTVLYLLVFGVAVALTHLLYLEVTMRTREDHRFTGYVGTYLGPHWKTITLVQGVITLWGTLLIYTIVAAGFLRLLLPTIPETYFGILFFLVGSVIIWRGDQGVGRQEMVFMVPMALLMIAIFAMAVTSPHFSSEHLFSLNLREWVLPYGIVLFSLAGFSVVPLLEHILAPARKQGLPLNYPFIIFTGTLLPALLYILFAWGVLGVSGTGTTENALDGLVAVLGTNVVRVGALLGIFSLYTSFIAIGNELARTFFEDYHLSRRVSFLLALVAPLVFYIANVKDFITLAGFVGAVMGGYVGVVSVLLFWKAKVYGNETPSFSFFLPKLLGFFIIGIFTFASLYAVIDIISSLLFASVPN